VLSGFPHWGRMQQEPDSALTTVQLAGSRGRLARFTSMQLSALAPCELNGDRPLTREERAAYMEFHEARNRVNATLSQDVGTRSGIRRVANVACVPPVPPGSSPSRVATLEFFACVAYELAPRWRGRPMTIVDIGAGAGGQLDPFIREGLEGHYIAVDITRNSRWKDGTAGDFTRELIINDINSLDVSKLPPIDLILSNTALEHIRDDVSAVRSLSMRLRPDGCQVHFVPGEASLPLYGPHGYRQYSPHCLAQLFPGAVIHRYGGSASNTLHSQWITPATTNGTCPRDENPTEYARLRALAMDEDERTGNKPAAMYGVVQS
jgi:SAM-dependent methyltransferase